MADAQYELLIVFKTQSELAGAIGGVVGQLKAAEELGARTFGPDSRMARGISTFQKDLAGAGKRTGELAGLQSVLGKAAATAGASLGGEGESAKQLAESIGIVNETTRAAATAKRIYSAISAKLPADIKQEVAASRSLADVHAALRKAFGDSSTEVAYFGTTIKGIAGTLADGTGAAKIASLAQKELGLASKATAAGLVANTAIGKTFAAAQLETTKAIDTTIKANQSLVAGTNLVPAAFQKSADAARASAAAMVSTTAIGKTVTAAQRDVTTAINETIKTNQELAAGSNILPAFLKKSADAQAALLQSSKNLTPAQKELKDAFGRLAVDGKGNSAVITTFRDALGSLNVETLKAISTSIGFRETAGRVGIALGLSGEATRAFAAQAGTLSGQQRQAALAAKINAAAQGELADRTQRAGAATAAQRQVQAQAVRDALNAATAVAVHSRAITGLGHGYSGLGRLAARGIAEVVSGSRSVQSAAGGVASATGAMAEGAGAAAGGLGALGAAGGPVAIGIAAAAVGALAASAAFKELFSSAIEASKAFDIVALRAPAESLAKLRAVVFELSSKTGVAFEELAEAQGRALLKVGGDAQKAERLLRVASETALAAFTSPVNAVEQLGDLMRNYGLSINEVKEASNSLLVLQRIAGEDFNQLGASLGPVIPVAKTLGFSIKDLTSSVAGMASQGLSGQQAVFGLRTDLANMAQPTSAISKEMRKLGVDMSDSANKARGIAGTFRAMDQALRRNGSSLAEFFGESRKSGPVYALLSEGGEKAAAAFREMSSGVDQAKKPIENLNTPLRELRNAMEALKNIIPQLGDALLSGLAPGVTNAVGLLQDLAFYFEQIEKKAPEAAKAIVLFGDTVKNNLPVVGKLFTVAELGGLAVEKLRKTIRGLADDMGLIPRPEFGPINDLFKAVAEGATESLAAYLRLEDRIKRRGILSAGTPPDMFRAFIVGAMEAARQVPQLAAAIDQLPAVAERAQRALGAVIRDAGFDDVVKKQIEKLQATGGGLLTQGFIDLVKTIRDTGEAQEVAAAFTRLYRTESEKTAASLASSLATYISFSTALKLNNADVTKLQLAFGRFLRGQQEIIAAQELAERATDGARGAVGALAASYSLASDKSLQLQNELRSEFEAFAKRNALLTLTGKTTSAATKSVAAIIDEQKLIIKAWDDMRGSVLEYQNTQRGTLGNLELQLTRVRTQAVLFSTIWPALSAEMLKFAKSFERDFVEPVRRGFAGGFGRGLDNFFRTASDWFERGKDAAAEFSEVYERVREQLKSTREAERTPLEAIQVDITKLTQLAIIAQVQGFIPLEASILKTVFALTKLAAARQTALGGFQARIKQFAADEGDAQFDLGVDQADKLIDAYHDIRSQAEQFKASQLTVTEQMALQVLRATELEAKLRVLEKFQLADRVKAVREEFEKMAAMRGNFGAGFTKGIKDFVDAAKDAYTLGAQAAGQFASQTTDALSGLLLSLGKGKQAFKDFAAAILQSMAQIIAKMIAFSITSAVFSTIGGPLSGFFSAFAGGLGGREKGGPVKKKKPYVVGEKGAEIHVPEEDGWIIPHAQTMRILDGEAPDKHTKERGGLRIGRRFAEGGVQRGELVETSPMRERDDRRREPSFVFKSIQSVARAQSRAARTAKEFLSLVLSGRGSRVVPGKSAVALDAKAAEQIAPAVTELVRRVSKSSEKAARGLAPVRALSPEPGAAERVRNESLMGARDQSSGAKVSFRTFSASKASTPNLSMATRLAAGIALSLIPLAATSQAAPRRSQAAATKPDVTVELQKPDTRRPILLERGGIVAGVLRDIRALPDVARQIQVGPRTAREDDKAAPLTGGSPGNLGTVGSSKTKSSSTGAQGVFSISRRLAAGLSRLLPGLGLDEERPGRRTATGGGGVAAAGSGAAGSAASPPSASQKGSPIARIQSLLRAAIVEAEPTRTATRRTIGSADVTSSVARPGGSSSPRATSSETAGRSRERGRGDLGLLESIGSLFQWSRALPALMNPRAFEKGGIATRPTLALFAEKPGMAEAFIPMPGGPNSGIPVEFKNLPQAPLVPSSGRVQRIVIERHLPVQVNLYMSSIDPSRAGHVVMAEMPTILKGIAAGIEGRKDTDLIAAIRSL